jgi:hypothetical protein
MLLAVSLGEVDDEGVLLNKALPLEEMLRLLREWDLRCACPCAILPPGPAIVVEVLVLCDELHKGEFESGAVAEDFGEEVEMRELRLDDAEVADFEGEEGEPGVVDVLLCALFCLARYDLSCSSVQGMYKTARCRVSRSTSRPSDSGSVEVPPDDTVARME